MLDFLITAIKFIFLLGFLVLIHEGGHFLVAKLFKVKVNEFSIGFGKKIFGKQKGETLYALRAVPLGGFVMLEGEEEESNDPRAFNNKSVWKRMLIIAAGGVVNIIFGLAVYFIIAMSLGNYYSMVISEPVQGYAAQQAGIQVGDELISANGQRLRLKTDLDNAVNNAQENTIQFVIKRNNEYINVDIKPTKLEDGRYVIGVNLKPAESNLANNIYYGFWNTANFSASIVSNVKDLLTGGVKTDQLMGPIGISTMVSQTDGLLEFVYLLALISLSLGVTNLLPFPPLDGGKLVLLLIEAIRRKKLSMELELNIQAAGFVLMILLSIYVAYNDILRIF